MQHSTIIDCGRQAEGKPLLTGLLPADEFGDVWGQRRLQQQGRRSDERRAGEQRRRAALLQTGFAWRVGVAE